MTRKLSQDELLQKGKGLALAIATQDAHLEDKKAWMSDWKDREKALVKEIESLGRQVRLEHSDEEEDQERLPMTGRIVPLDSKDDKPE